MLRKLLVNALALLAVLALAGGAMAAVSTVGQERRAEKAGQTDDDAPDDANDATDDANDVVDDVDDAAEGADEADGFGAARSAEVAAYHECRDAAADETAADECEKPGPAWENPAHPVFGDDGEKAGQTPGGAAREAAQQRREEAGTQRPERAPGDADDADDADDDDDDDQDVEVTTKDDRGRQQAAQAKAGKGNGRR